MQNDMTTTSKSERLTTVLYVTNSLLPLKPELPSRVVSAVCCVADEGEIVVPIKMTRAAGTVRIDIASHSHLAPSSDELGVSSWQKRLH